MTRRGHERDSLHRGDLPATLVELFEAIGSYPAGTTLDSILKDLWDRVAFWETNPPVFRGGFRTDAILFRQWTRTFKLDAWLKYRSFVADAIIYGTKDGSLSVDAYLGGPQVFGSFWADALLHKPASGTILANSVLKGTRSSTFFLDSRLVWSFFGSFTADANLRATVERNFAANSVVMVTQAGAFLVDAALANTISASLVADSVIFRTMTGAIQANAVFLKGQAGSFSQDSVLVRTYAGSLLADAVFLGTRLSSFLMDSYFASNATERTGSFTADGIFKKTQSLTFASDAQIQKTGIVRPTSDQVTNGTVTRSSGTTNYTLIDEVTLDTADWVDTKANSTWFGCGFGSLSLTSSNYIQKIIVEWRGANAAPANAGSVYMYNPSNSNKYEIQSILQSGSTYSITRTTRPWDNAALDYADVNNLWLGAGYGGSVSFPKVRTTQMYVTIYYQ